MDFQTFGRIPLDFTELVIDGTVQKLDATKHNYAVVQFLEITVGDYTEASRIARYNVQDIDPSLVSGFVAGDTDTRIFTKGELDAGVKITTAELGVTCQAVIQYYNKL